LPIDGAPTFAPRRSVGVDVLENSAQRAAL
jgi:hypothetical protein